MDVVHELRRKQDDLKADRNALVDRLAEIDRKIAAVDTVIQIYEPGHSPRKAAAQRGRKGGQFLGGLFADESLRSDPQHASFGANFDFNLRMRHPRCAAEGHR